MCRFLSAIVKKTGDLICMPEVTDSHEDLIEHAGLHDDNSHIRSFVRVEYHPGDANLHELDKYELYVDERDPPDWFDEKMKEKTERKLYQRVKKMIISDEKPILLGGCYILHGEAKIRKVKGSRIISMRDNASVKNVWDNASVTDVRDNASMKHVWGNASVTDVGGNASVTDVWGNASVTDVGGNASVTDVRDNASVSGVRGNASVSSVGDNASVSDVWDNASVSGVWGNASVSDVRDNASVSDVWGNASVSGVRDNAKIINDKRKKRE